MIEKKPKITLPSLDDLFSTEASRVESALEKVQNINISDIDNFKNHPFKVLDNDDLYKMVDSIIEKGVLVPAIIRPKENGRYEMVSGHRRKRASELAGKETIPAIIRDMTDDEATIVMVDSNIHREEILPSEKAFAYKMKLEAMVHQGKNINSTCDQVGHKLKGKKSVEILADEVGDCKSNVQRYIRLTNLITELLDYVDSGKIAFNPAVELSYLSKDEQIMLLDCIKYNDTTPSHSQAIRMKELSKNGGLTTDDIEDIMSELKPNQVSKIAFNENRIKSVLPQNIKEESIEDYVVKSIEFYTMYLHKSREKSNNQCR